MAQDLSHWVRSFCGRRVLLVGDLILDRYLYGDAERISPEAPVPVYRCNSRFYRLGGAANVAHNIKAMGGSCTLVGKGIALLRRPVVTTTWGEWKKLHPNTTVLQSSGN